MEEKLRLTEEWDKTFPKSDKVDHRKVTFHNRYGITLISMRRKERRGGWRPSRCAGLLER